MVIRNLHSTFYIQKDSLLIHPGVGPGIGTVGGCERTEAS